MTVQALAELYEMDIELLQVIDALKPLEWNVCLKNVQLKRKKECLLFSCFLYIFVEFSTIKQKIIQN